MRKALLIPLTTILFGCETIFDNRCTTDWAINLVKKKASQQILLEEEFSAAFSDKNLSGNSPSVDDYASKMKVIETSKPKKVEDGTYECSAILELNGNKYGVVYFIKELRFGKSDYDQLIFHSLTPLPE